MQQAKYSDTGWAISGSVTFKNGDTEGKQRFEAPTWDEVELQIKNFIGTLK